uniref:Immunodominant membrane protein n=7 Tax=Candidatus Phytoplasma TaxID=33926 RepID=A0A076V3E0_9MOLU|nr:immunodominant membrane protein [Cauliflower phyllody phytoplasma]AGT17677.1 immunodominant membrane protein [Parthenium weed witches'-broom phytoplasma]AGT17678.1 immunodominant membrane protein [Peanut witches'-broom phytoplasma]AGT17680.1 immunodominant membrane protein [Tomato big bud phytoplasma]AIK19296.1 immunodominant membrane protein [String bean virescence phytoplasma]AIK19299.1 immunodominant membrane protein ['Cichorium intybus' witches'-broom phytoplasma]AIK19300.1 immunodomin
MNHKENFLQTKNGKITVGVLASAGIALVVYLITAKLLHWAPFTIKTLTTKDIDNLKVEIKDFTGVNTKDKLSSDDAKQESQKAFDAINKIVDAFAENNKADIKDKKISDSTIAAANNLKTKADNALKFVNENASVTNWTDDRVQDFVNNKVVKTKEINDLLSQAKTDLKVQS